MDGGGVRRRGGLQVAVLAAVVGHTIATVIAEAVPMGERVSTALFVLSIVSAAVIGGLVGGSVATVLAIAGEWYFFLGSENGFQSLSEADTLTLAVLAGCGALLTGIVQLLDVTRRRAERESRRTRALQELAVRLSSLDTSDSVYERAAEEARQATGAAWAKIEVSSRTAHSGRASQWSDAISERRLPRLEGSLRLGFDKVGPADGRQPEVADAVASQCSSAIERIQLRRVEQRLQADEEFLAKAAAALTAALDTDSVLETLGELIVPERADRLEVSVTGDGRSHTFGAAALGAPEVVTIPLVARGSEIGQLRVARAGGFALGTKPLLLRLAETAAHVLDIAILFEERSETAQTLQSSLLPPQLWTVPGLEVAARYLAAGEHTEVGGDFYDSVVSNDDVISLVIGDVQGKGIDAAALTATARQTLRATALGGSSPRDMLLRVNQVLLYEQGERRLAGDDDPLRLVTAAVVQLRRAGEGFAGVACCGGHPPPLIVRVGGDIEHLTSLGMVLGYSDQPSLQEQEFTLDLADTLVLFTDGITEAHYGRGYFGEENLGRLIRNRLGMSSAGGVAALVESTVRDLALGRPRDDIAVLVAKVVMSR
ncbi:MAG: PP2C family protein-serine/threonine phosphatase [Acidimicrobiales bacterium]